MPQKRFPQRQSNPESIKMNGQSEECRKKIPGHVNRTSPCSPVRPTLLRHMKHLFFLGLGMSTFPSSLLEGARGAGLEGAGWFTTMHKKRGKGSEIVTLEVISDF